MPEEPARVDDIVLTEGEERAVEVALPEASKRAKKKPKRVEPEVDPDDPEPWVSQAERDWRVADDYAWMLWYAGDPGYHKARRKAEALFDKMRDQP